MDNLGTRLDDFDGSPKNFKAETYPSAQTGEVFNACSRSRRSSTQTTRLCKPSVQLHLLPTPALRRWMSDRCEQP